MLKGEADQSLFKVNSSRGDEVDPKEAIFPILKTKKDGATQMLGTGFFVTRTGIFISAKHIFDEVIGDNIVYSSGLNIIQFSENNIFYVRPVRGCVVHGEADVAIGICAPMSHNVTKESLFNKVLTLSGAFPHLHEHVCTFAYPGTTVTQTAITHVEFRAKFYAGKIEEYYPNGRDKVLLPYPCYRTSIVLHGGSSGGPVFGQNSNVIGVNSTGVEGEDNISYVSRIQDVFDLQIPNVVLPGSTEPKSICLRGLKEIDHVAIK